MPASARRHGPGCRSIGRITRERSISSCGWRRAHPALLVGDLAGLRREGDCLAFERRTASAAIFCAFNLSNRPCRMTVFDADPLDPPGGTAAWDAEGVTLPAWGAGFAALAGGNRHDG
jgi:alpha-glucosidase